MKEERDYEKLARFLESPETRKSTKPKTITIEFAASRLPEIAELNRHLNPIEGDEGVEVFVDLMDLYYNRDDSKQELRVKTFGQKFLDLFKDESIQLATLNAPRTSFRLWYAAPASLSPDHADSCGRGLFASVYGDPEFVEKCSQKKYPENGYYNFRIQVPNGHTLFLPWSYR